MDIVTIAIALVITILAALLASFLPKWIKGVLQFVVFIFLVGMWLKLLGIPVLADLIDSLEWMVWPIAAVGGIALGDMIGGFLGIGG